jgi:hypothetical protein
LDQLISWTTDKLLKVDCRYHYSNAWTIVAILGFRLASFEFLLGHHSDGIDVAANKGNTLLAARDGSYPRQLGHGSAIHANIYRDSILVALQRDIAWIPGFEDMQIVDHGGKPRVSWPSDFSATALRIGYRRAG